MILIYQPRRRRFSLFTNKRVVHHKESLGGNGADGAPARDKTRRRQIKGFKDFRLAVAEQWDVDAAAVVGELIAILGGGIGSHVRTAPFEIKPSTDGEHR